MERRVEIDVSAVVDRGVAERAGSADIGERVAVDADRRRQHLAADVAAGRAAGDLADLTHQCIGAGAVERGKGELIRVGAGIDGSEGRPLMLTGIEVDQSCRRIRIGAEQARVRAVARRARARVGVDDVVRARRIVTAAAALTSIRPFD